MQVHHLLLLNFSVFVISRLCFNILLVVMVPLLISLFRLAWFDQLTWAISCTVAHGNLKILDCSNHPGSCGHNFN